MKWSVMLFGHEKPKFELREKKKTMVRLPKGENSQGKMVYEDRLINQTVARYIERPEVYDSENLYVYEWTDTERRAAPGDVISYKAETIWNVSSQKEFEEIQGMIRNPAYIQGVSLLQQFGPLDIVRHFYRPRDRGLVRPQI